MDDETFKLPTIPLLQVPVGQMISPPKRSLKPSFPPASSSSTSKQVVSQEQAPLPGLQLPKLCPSCSIVLLQYLKPLQQYLNQVLNLTLGNLNNETEASTIIQELKENLVDMAQSTPSKNASNDTNQNKSLTKETEVFKEDNDSKNKIPSNSYMNQERSREKSNQINQEWRQEKGNQINQEWRQEKGSQMNQEWRQENSSQMNQEWKQENSSQMNQEGKQEKSSQSFTETKTTVSSQLTNDSHVMVPVVTSSGESHVVQESTWQEPQGEEPRQTYEGNREPSSEKRNDGTKNVTFELQEPFKVQNQEVSSSNSNFVPETLASPARQESGVGQVQGVPSAQEPSVSPFNESGQQSYAPATGHFEEYHDWTDYPSYDQSNQEDYIQPPFAFVTIVYDNLSAVNAIILANSMVLSTAKRITRDGQTFSIPHVVMIGGLIDDIFLNHFDNIFDEVITTSHDARLSLLSDESFGVSHMKIQLWKNLMHYEKCLFIESTSLVVNNIDDVFLTCSELSATVDWMFPDSFSCSVFVFEPNERTYNDLVKFATQMVREADDPDLTSLDEMTILNQFFSNKWQKMSFIYNYSQNNSVYTQTPAFARFGGSIKIVNFDFTPIGAPGGNRDNSPTSQPWQIPFDLNRSTQAGQVHTNVSINNYIRFYLDIFLKRVWPILRVVSLCRDL